MRTHRVTFRAGLVAVAGLVGAATACTSAPELTLSASAQEGKALYDTNGCASCHGQNGLGGVGPALAGIAGTNIALSNGSSVPADRAYLIESILQPQAQLVDGYNIKMPQNQLSETQADLVAQFIEELPSP